MRSGRRDPKQRDDHRCAQPGCKKPLEQRAIAGGDPFCSNTCCLTYHGIPSSFPAEEPIFGGGYGRQRKGGERVA